MDKPIYVIAYDIGTTGNKTCLFEIKEKISLVTSAMKEFSLTILENGGVEQDPEEWWQGLKETTEAVLLQGGIKKEQVIGISFCSQMQGLVLVDKQGQAVRPAMSYMDQRAGDEKKDSVGHGVQIQGINIRKILKSLYITGVAPVSVKDPLWRYKWVQTHEPEIMTKTHKWLDVKEYLISRCTDKFVMTNDSAFATFLYNYRKEQWSSSLCKMYGVDKAHLPLIISSTDSVGCLTISAADQLGLSPECQVFGGGGDASLIGVGAGAVDKGDSHIYSGTSGWFSTITDKMTIDLDYMIASVVGAKSGLFNYFGELETAGKSLEWVKNHLALDAIDIYLKKTKVTDGPEAITKSLYDHMCESIKDIDAGSGGVIFTPWLHGNRCPFEDTNARGMFFNISLDTGKRKLIRAVLEGIAYHIRWMMEVSHKKVEGSKRIRFVGGGALSPLLCQIFADVTGHTIDTVDSPQNVGAVGAAACCGIGLGKIEGFSQLKKFIPIKASYTPNPEVQGVHESNYLVFKRLYKDNKKNFALLNG